MFIFYLLILATNIAFEVFVTSVIGSSRIGRIPPMTVVWSCVCLNLVSHPLASIAYHELHIPIIPIELFIFVGEALGYRLLVRSSWPLSFIMSALANTTTFLAGLFFM